MIRRRRWPAGQRRALVQNARLHVAVGLGRVASSLSRLLRRGDGFVIGGRVILAGCPDAFARLLAGHRTAFVSATNGKTTTTRLLAAAMATAGPVITNTSGANMPAGLVAALARVWRDVPAPAPVVLEADETYLPRLLPAASTPVLVLGNLSRDQLDRVGEVAMVARRWRTAFAAADGAVAVANADDPHVVWAAGVIPQVTWVSVGNTWTADSVLCPACGAILHRDGHRDGHRDERREAHPDELPEHPPEQVSEKRGRGWYCDCGFARPQVAWRLDDGAVVDPQGTRYPLNLALPGAANQANATMAVAAAQLLGVPATRSVPALRSVVSVGGRYQVVQLGGRQVRLLLGKNPAGWAELFAMLAPAPAPVVIAINARAADGKDPSWLWDVPFERLADRFVVATGERRHDLAVRLLYADVRHTSVVDPWADPPAELGGAGSPGQAPLDAVGTYTAFRDLLRRGGGADDDR